jgi:hypothetical protein
MRLDRDRPEILEPPEHPQACCQQQTITVPPDVLAKTAQKHDYPSAAWRRSYARRTGAERGFSTAKDPASNDVVAHWLQHTSRDGDMQLHVHSQIAHVARTATDGKWRAPDSLGYNEHIGAVGAITAQRLEEALTARFGLEWTARNDGHGFEITGIPGEMIRLFSSRRESITADLRGRAARFEQQYGRGPSQRELAQLAQASNFATRKSKEATLDAEQLHADWADRLARSLGVRLAEVAPSVWHAGARSPAQRTRDGEAPETVPSELLLSRAAQQAVALAQQEKSTWTRADLVKYLGRVLPRSGRDPDQAAALLLDLADRALGSEFEPVICLEAPEPAEVPRGLLRADGRSVCRRHGGVRTCVPPGTGPWPPWARPATTASGACPTACCSPSAPATRPKRPGRRRGPATSSARPVRPPGRPASPLSARLPKPAPPTAAASPSKQRGTKRWQPATRPCTTPTASAKPHWPPR